MINQAIGNLPEGLHPLDVQQLLMSAAKWMSEQAGVGPAMPGGVVGGMAEGVTSHGTAGKVGGTSPASQSGHFLPDDKDSDDSSEQVTTLKSPQKSVKLFVMTAIQLINVYSFENFLLVATSIMIVI